MGRALHTGACIVAFRCDAPAHGGVFAVERRSGAGECGLEMLIQPPRVSKSGATVTTYHSACHPSRAACHR